MPVAANWTNQHHEFVGILLRGTRRVEPIVFNRKLDEGEQFREHRLAKNYAQN
jgi:hypothetical protein